MEIRSVGIDLGKTTFPLVALGEGGKVLGFVVRRDWNFARSGKPAAIFQKLYRSEDPAKRSSQTEGNVS